MRAPDVSRQLREARAERGIELDEVQRATKIHSRFLRAMEEDRWGDLPGPAYARGFLATYAHFLGLEGTALVEAYRVSEGPEEPAGPIPEEMLPRRGVVKRRHSVRRRLALAAAAAAAVAALIVAGAFDDPEPSGSGLGAEIGERTDREPQPTDTTTTTTTDPDRKRREEPKSVSRRVPLQLEASGDVWVCIQAGDGRVFIPGETVAAGERRGPFRARSFRLSLGNGSLRIELDGNRVPIPDASEPLGYKITADGREAIPPEARPDCL